MKTVYQLRKERNLTVPFKEDSDYKPIERVPIQFNPLIIPKAIERDLPFHLTKKNYHQIIPSIYYQAVWSF